MEAASSAIDALHGALLSAAQGGLLANCLQALARRLPDLPTSVIPAATPPLTRVRAALANRRDGRSFVEIAQVAGFAGQSHCNRLLQEA